jgi:type II secretory pathway component GspD/PulD (secretin)
MKRQLGQYVVFLGIFLVISGISVFPVLAEEPDAGASMPSPMRLAGTPATASPASHGTPAKAAGVKAEKTAAGRYYLDFKAASLINVLNVLSSLSGINFVAGPEVADRKINMTLDNVSLEDVLQSIAGGSNVSYDFIPGRNIYLFRASSDAPEKPPLVTRVFRLYYVLVSSLKEIDDNSSSFGSGTSSGSSSSGSSSSSGGLSSGSSGSSSSGSSSSGSSSGGSDIPILGAIEKILSERGKISADDRSNSLIVTDTEDRLKMIEAAIMQLDRPLDQVLINVLLVETFEDLSRDLGVTWGDSNGLIGTVKGGSESTSFPFLNNPATGAASSPSMNFFQGLYKGLASVPDQFNPGKTTGATVTPGLRDFTSFQISLTALESASKLKILAKPKVLVLDNHPAIVKISTNAAIGTTTTTTSSSGGETSSNVERAEVGTILRVTPLINTGDRITMTVEPTFATVDKSAIQVQGGPTAGTTGDPTVRTARTTLMVNDGQTIALGGLLMSTQSNGNRKVPFFGNLPVVGKAFFTSNDKTLQDRELILFVTPNIIRDPSVLQTSSVPDKRLSYEDETAPFWKVKQKEWYKTMKDGPEKQIDFDSYFNVRKKLMETTLAALDQNEKAASQEKP